MFSELDCDIHEFTPKEDAYEYLLREYLLQSDWLSDEDRELYEAINHQKIEEKKQRFIENIFPQIDINRDGLIDKKEFENFFINKMPNVSNTHQLKILTILSKWFKTSDKANKGNLTMDDLHGMRNLIIEWFMHFNQFNVMDANRNSVVTEKEFSVWADRL